MGQCLAAIHSRYLVIDAELIGIVTRWFTFSNKDYQELTIWAYTLRIICRLIMFLGYVPVVPMTILEIRPRQRIIEYLRGQGVTVFEVMMVASHETLESRITERGGRCVSWCLRALPRFEDLVPGTVSTIQVCSEHMASSLIGELIDAMFTKLPTISNLHWPFADLDKCDIFPRSVLDGCCPCSFVSSVGCLPFHRLTGALADRLLE